VVAGLYTLAPATAGEESLFCVGLL